MILFNESLQPELRYQFFPHSRIQLHICNHAQSFPIYSIREPNKMKGMKWNKITLYLQSKINAILLHL